LQMPCYFNKPPVDQHICLLYVQVIGQYFIIGKNEFLKNNKSFYETTVTYAFKVFASENFTRILDLIFIAI